MFLVEIVAAKSLLLELADAHARRVEHEDCERVVRSIELAQQYLKPGQRASYTIQTNGTLLDEEWAAFFKANDFLVGISIDGPREMHDAHRVNKGGKGSFDQVMRGLEFLRKGGSSGTR